MVQANAILSLIFATFTTLTMLGLEVNGIIKKHTESIYLSIVIRSIQMFIYICVAIGAVVLGFGVLIDQPIIVVLGIVGGAAGFVLREKL